jgi:hypothetical protein
MKKHISGILIANNYLMKCKLEHSNNLELARKLLSYKIKEALEVIKTQQSTLSNKKAKN